LGADRNTLDALRRLAKDRAATPAEKATARRLAKALAAKIGKRPRRSRRKGHGPVLVRERRPHRSAHPLGLAERMISIVSATYGEFRACTALLRGKHQVDHAAELIRDEVFDDTGTVAC